MGIRSSSVIRIARVGNRSTPPVSLLPRWRPEDLSRKTLETCPLVEPSTESLALLLGFIKRNRAIFRGKNGNFGLDQRLAGSPDYTLGIYYSSDEKKIMVIINNPSGWQQFYKCNFDLDGNIIGKCETFGTFYLDMFRHFLGFVGECRT